MQRVIRACCACAPKGAAKPLVLLVTAGQRHEVTQLGRLLDELGVAVTGELTGQRLQRVAIQLVAWRDFRAAFPAGRVLSRDTGHRRPYGENPYPLYDRRAPSRFCSTAGPTGGWRRWSGCWA